MGLLQGLAGIGVSVGRAVLVEQNGRRVFGKDASRIGGQRGRDACLLGVGAPNLSGSGGLGEGGTRFGVVLNGVVADPLLDLLGSAGQDVLVDLGRNGGYRRAHENAHDGSEHADLRREHHRREGGQTRGDHLHGRNVGKERGLLLFFGGCRGCRRALPDGYGLLFCLSRYARPCLTDA